MSKQPILPVNAQAFTVVTLVAAAANVTPRLILGDSRTHKITELRRQACYLMHTVLGLSNSEIAEALGRYDPSTVQHHLRTAGVQYGKDPAFAALIDGLKDKVEGLVADMRRHPLPEQGVRAPGIEPLDVARRVMRAARGEVSVSGAEMRVLAEAYVDTLLAQLGDAV